MASGIGGKKANQRGKDQSRAADLKARGVVRRTARCPLCYRIVGIDMYAHVASGCKGN